MPVAKQEFVMKHTFKNVSKIKEGINSYSNREEHFGVPWKIRMYRKENHFGFYLYCLIEQRRNWLIRTDFELKIVSGTGKEKAVKTNYRYEDESPAWGWSKFIDCDSMMKEYVTNDSLMVEVHVTIKMMTGVRNRNLDSGLNSNHRNFDVAELSDVVLVVERQKFYVSKFYLATQSTYFKSLLLGRFKESRMSEIKLDGIESKDFQNFLEVLYLAPAIDDDTVDGIIKLADMYDSQVVVKKCEGFLVQESKKSAKEKLSMAVKYKLDKLKNHCLSKINNINDVKSILPGDLSELDPSIATEILQKCVGFEYASKHRVSVVFIR